MKLTKLVAAAAVALGSVGAAHAVPVALELSLLIDVSGSVDSNEYKLQRDGYVAAFKSASVQSAIAGLTGGIAVNFIQWSGANQQSQRVGWTHLTDAASANAFATAISNVTQEFQGLTAPGSALNFATPLFGSNLFEGLRQVIDVSGDGQQNDGFATSTARDNALAAGIDAINGLAIEPAGSTSLLNWYNANIVGGTNSFALSATFENFAAAVTTKIGREITPVPEPTSIALVGLALAGLGVSTRRRKA